MGVPTGVLFLANLGRRAVVVGVGALQKGSTARRRSAPSLTQAGASSVYAPRLMPKALPAEGGHSPPQARKFLGCVCFYSKKWCFLHGPGRPPRQRRAPLPVLLIAHRIKQQVWVWGVIWGALATHGVSASPPFRPSTCACGRKPFWMLWLHMECDGNARRDGGGTRSASRAVAMQAAHPFT